MIQFNLLPDLKLKYIKAKRFKHTAMIVSFLITASSLAIFIFLFMTVYVFQKNHINAVTNDINSSQQKLDETKDLNKVLTIQNQLNSLPGLHDQKPTVSRFFGYVTQLTPKTEGNVSLYIGKFNISYVDTKITFEGGADSFSTINKFVDTIKFATFVDTLLTKEEQTELAKSGKNKPFSDVVLDSQSIEDDKARYIISFKFDPAIFDNSKKIKLEIPNIISTRSETEKPVDLFKVIPKAKSEKVQ